jgi:hypothetical protein
VVNKKGEICITVRTGDANGCSDFLFKKKKKMFILRADNAN